MIVIPENAVEIAGVVIAYGCTDIGDGKAGTLQQKGCLVQPFDLEKLLVGPSQEPFDCAAEPGHLIAHDSGQICQLPVPVVFIDVAQHLENQLLAVGTGIGVNTVGVVHQVKKQKPHGHLVDAALVGLVV